MRRDLVSIMFAPFMLDAGLRSVMEHATPAPTYRPPTRTNFPQPKLRKKGKKP